MVPQSVPPTPRLTTSATPPRWLIRAIAVEKDRILGTWCIGCAVQMRPRSRKLTDVPPRSTEPLHDPSNQMAQRSVDPVRSAPETSNLWHPPIHRSAARRGKRPGRAAPAVRRGLQKNPEDFWGNAPLARQLISDGQAEEDHPCATAGSRTDEAATTVGPGTATRPAGRAAPARSTAERGSGAARPRAGGSLCGRGGTGRCRAGRAAGGPVCGPVSGPSGRGFAGFGRRQRSGAVVGGIVAGTVRSR